MGARVYCMKSLPCVICGFYVGTDNGGIMTQKPDNLSSDIRIKGILALALASLITGILAGSLAGVGAVLLGEESRSLLEGVGAGVLVSLLAWVLLLRFYTRLISLANGVDPEPPMVEETRLELSIEGGRTLQFARIPLDPETLARFAGELVQGWTTTESRWLGVGIFRSRSHWIQFREEIIHRKWAAWISEGDHSQGFIITSAGRSVFRYLAGVPSPAGDVPEIDLLS